MGRWVQGERGRNGRFLELSRLVSKDMQYLKCANENMTSETAVLITSKSLSIESKELIKCMLMSFGWSPFTVHL